MIDRNIKNEFGIAKIQIFNQKKKGKEVLKNDFIQFIIRNLSLAKNNSINH